MAQTPHELARVLAERAELACRHYLPNGMRQGNYWQVGDARNAPGRSMFVRLSDTAQGVAGKWTDAATGEHGDLLDIIREACGLADFRDVVSEARRFLSLPVAEVQTNDPAPGKRRARSGGARSARRLFAMGQPAAGTLVEDYLRGRRIMAFNGTGALRYHPRCYYRARDNGLPQTWPAMLAAVTDLAGTLTGVHRTWLDPAGFNETTLGKAPIDAPRRALGGLLGHAVRFDHAGPVMAAGEGIETVLSLRCALTTMPMMAALSAAHLAAIAFPLSLRRLYVARDADPAGAAALATLTERATQAGIEIIELSPEVDDFNDDLRKRGVEALRDRLRQQLARQDADLFLAQ